MQAYSAFYRETVREKILLKSFIPIFNFLPFELLVSYVN